MSTVTGRPETAPAPYQYRRAQLAEPDWRRFPAWSQVSAREWRDPQWQRAHSVKSVRQLRDALGPQVSEAFYQDVARDQERFATMPILLPPHVVNTMVPDAPPGADALYADPVRRYMLPAASDRHPDWPSHPVASRDSLHESEMWVVEGLTHRYPTKVLAEVVATCPQYCGHCTRMDLVGTATEVTPKYRFALRPADRLDRMVGYLQATPQVRDVVVSGGDAANLPWPRLEAFLLRLLDIEHIRDIRIATKALVGLPQHWLAGEVRAGMERVAAAAFARGVSLAVHTHANAAQQVTPLVQEAARAMLAAGVRDVRNQGVLLRGVNDSAQALLDLCFALVDGGGPTPYYFYLCDIIPSSEHWRLSLAQAQALQESIMGYLPGFATPRLVCDVPYAGKRWVHQNAGYDRETGVSYWTKNYLTLIEADDPRAAERTYTYHDPVYTLPESGQEYWRRAAGVSALERAR